MTDVNVPQPPPKPSDGPDVWDVVIQSLRDTASRGQYYCDPAILDLMVADAKERNAAGIAKYGVPLRPHNGRNNLVDLLQEVMDAIAYATADQIEQIAANNDCPEMDEIFVSLFDVWYCVRDELERRKASTHYQEDQQWSSKSSSPC